VRRIFDKLLRREHIAAGAPSSRSPFPREFYGAESEWKQILAAHAFKEPEKAFRVLREFVEGPGYGHLSPRTK